MGFLQDTAIRYRQAGLNILPAWKNTKRPSTADWRCFQEERFEGKYLTDAICVVCGKISGNVEVIDFDKQAVSFNDWRQEVLSRGNYQPLLDALLIERTQSGGLHVAYRVEDGCLEPTQKLCAIKIGETYEVSIETRSEGSIALIAPSDGYTIEQGDWASLVVLDKETRQVLIDSARALTEQVIVPKLRTAPVEFKDIHKETIGEDVAIYLREDDASRRLLLKHGWSPVCEYKGNKELWRRPNKNKGVSASLDKDTGLVYVWTSNAYPLEGNTQYTPLQLLAELEYNGDLSEASKDVIRTCKQDDEPVYKSPFTIRSEAEIKALEPTVEEQDEPSYASIYEVPFPEVCLNPGGFLEATMDYIDSISMRNQRKLAFGASITALGHVLSRRLVYKYSDLTPAIYTIGICPPSSGKSAARRALQRLFNTDPSGLSSLEIIESIESVQALQSAIQQYKKCFLMQDEFGGWLTATMRETSNGNKSRIIDEILKLFSESSNPHYVPRITAGNFKKDGEITPVEYPSFSMYAVTNLLELQTSLNERLLSNGFIARVLFIAGDSDAPLKLPSYEELKQRGQVKIPEVIEKVFKGYLSFRAIDPINNRSPQLFPVDISEEAYNLIYEYASNNDKEYLQFNETEAFDLKTIKGRAFEKTIKYALNFCASRYGANEERLIIDEYSMRQAIELSKYEYALYEFLAKTEIAETEMSRNIKKVEKWLRSLKEDTFTKSVFTRCFQKFDLQDRLEILKTLEDRGVLVIEHTVIADSKKKTTLYHINRGAL